MSKQNTIFNVTFVSKWEEGDITTSAKLDIQTGRVFDVGSSDDGVNYQSLNKEVIEVLSGCADVDSREYLVELGGDDDYYIADDADLATLRVALCGSLDDTSDVTLNTFDDEGNVVDTTSMDLSKSAISDIIDHAAQLVLVLRTGGDAQSVLDELEEALVVSGVIADSDAEIGLSSAPKENADVAKKLAKAIKDSGLTLNGLPVTHGRALEVVSQVSGLPNWDTLSAVLKKSDVKVPVEPMDAESIIDRYYRKDSSCCPYCHSDDISGDSVDINGGDATQGISCNTCDSSWVDVYKLQGVDLTCGEATSHTLAIRMESDIYGAETFEYESLEDRVEGLKRLMFDKALKDGVARTYTFLLLDDEREVVEDAEDVVAEWTGKKWKVDELNISMK